MRRPLQAKVTAKDAASPRYLFLFLCILSRTMAFQPGFLPSATYKTNTPIFWAGMVLAGVIITGLVFFLYDHYNYKHQAKITKEKARAEAVVSSLFPKHVGDRLLQDHSSEGQSTRSDSDCDVDKQQSKPMAEVFPSATVLFADISVSFRNQISHLLALEWHVLL